MKILCIGEFVCLFVKVMWLTRLCSKYEHSDLVCKNVNIALLLYVALHYIALLVVADVCLVFGKFES